MIQPSGDASVFSDFELAALACGHDPASVQGRSDARNDHRVHDLLEAWAIQNHITTARAAIESSTAVSWP